MDRVELLKPGSGKLELGTKVTDTQVGAFLDLESRLNKSLAVFARADAGYDWDERTRYYGAMAGLRWHF